MPIPEFVYTFKCQDGRELIIRGMRALRVLVSDLSDEVCGVERVQKIEKNQYAGPGWYAITIKDNNEETIAEQFLTEELACIAFLEEYDMFLRDKKLMDD